LLTKRLEALGDDVVGGEAAAVVLKALKVDEPVIDPWWAGTMLCPTTQAQK
jgi:hypothetical protein